MMVFGKNTQQQWHDLCGNCLVDQSKFEEMHFQPSIIYIRTHLNEWFIS